MVAQRSRTLRVETTMATTRVSPTKSTRATPNTPPVKRFMQSTASSSSRVRNEAEELGALKSNVLRFTRSSDRRMLLRALKGCSWFNNIPVNKENLQYPTSEKEMEALEVAVADSMPIIVNGMELNGERKHHKLEKLELVEILCHKLAQGLPSNTDTTADDLYLEVLVRLAPSVTLVQSVLTDILGAPKELTVDLPKKPVVPIPRPSLKLYADGTSVHAVFDHYYGLGLFRKSDVITKPWVGVTAHSHSRINLTTGTFVRSISLEIHEDRYSVY